MTSYGSCAPALVTPEAAFAPRLVLQTHAWSLACTPPALGSAPPAPAPKISSSVAEGMRRKFIDDYAGELLSPANTPSVEFLARLRSELDSALESLASTCVHPPGAHVIWAPLRPGYLPDPRHRLLPGLAM